MNTIHIDNNSNLTNITISEDTNIFYNNAKSNITIEVLKDCKVFEYIKDSDIETNYKMTSSLYINRFVVDSSVKTSIDLDKEEIELNYYYSNINILDNKYEITINHNKEKTVSNVINHGINLSNNKLLYIVNGKVLKSANGVFCNQDSKIILTDDNNCLIKPNLIIDNDDVIANHYSYIGYFKKDEMFYLKARGINELNSEKLLVKSFLIGNMDISYEERKIILENIDSHWR